MDRDDLPAELVHKAGNFKIRGSSGKFAQYRPGRAAPIQWPGQEQSADAGDMHFTDSLGDWSAYDDWKAGTWSKDPYVDMLILAQTDPTMAPRQAC